MYLYSKYFYSQEWIENKKIMSLQINHRIRDVCINTKKQLEKLFKKKNLRR